MQYTFTRLELTETQTQKIKPNQEIPLEFTDGN